MALTDFFKFTTDVDIDPLNRFVTSEVVKIDFGPIGATLHMNALNAKANDHAPIKFNNVHPSGI